MLCISFVLKIFFIPSCFLYAQNVFLLFLNALFRNLELYTYYFFVYLKLMLQTIMFLYSLIFLLFCNISRDYLNQHFKLCYLNKSLDFIFLQSQFLVCTIVQNNFKKFRLLFLKIPIVICFQRIKNVFLILYLQTFLSLNINYSDVQ